MYSRILGIGIVLICMAFTGSPVKSTYKVFDNDGVETTYAAMLEAASETEVVLFGEFHNNPICHWLELELTKDLFARKGDSLLLGAEMFETDNQLLLNEYLSGQIREKNFEDEAKLWPNYKTDYKPLIDFAKDNNTGFVATNIPRRYASKVFHGGLASLGDLSDGAKALLPPLPIEVDLELPGYQSLLEMADNENFAHAQAVKDASMGYFISKAMPRDGLFLHYNGAYHSDNFEGISWYIEHYAPKTKVVTISSVEQDDVEELLKENIGKADFTICIPSSMTKTY